MAPADFNHIIANLDKIETLSFYFGIKNYKEIGTKNFKPMHTLMIIPELKKTLNQKVSSMPAGYDFVEPCPGSPSCPK